MLVDEYLRLLHWDRNLPLVIDWGPFDIHIVGRSVFYLWVTLIILALAGIAVFASRKRELIQKWTTWVLILPVVGIPIWLGRGPTAVLAAVLAVIAVCEYARLVKLNRVDTSVLLGLAVLYPLTAWLHPSWLGLAAIGVLLCALPAVLGGDVADGSRRAAFTGFGSV